MQIFEILITLCYPWNDKSIILTRQVWFALRLNVCESITFTTRGVINKSGEKYIQELELKKKIPHLPCKEIPILADISFINFYIF